MSGDVMRCPQCDCPRFVLAPYDLGVDKETGYHNKGVRAVCAECGLSAEAEDFQCADSQPAMDGAMKPGETIMGYIRRYVKEEKDKEEKKQ